MCTIAHNCKRRLDCLAIHIDLCVCVFIYQPLKRRWLHGTIAVTSGMNHGLSELYYSMTGHFPLSNGQCFLQGLYILLASHRFLFCYVV